MKFDYKNYEILIKTLLESHIPVTFPERFPVDTPAFIMRHDIDYGLEFLGEIPDIEKNYGVSATYFIQVTSDFYNPFSTSQANVIDTVLKLGHRLGLHFDCCKGGDEITGEEVHKHIERESGLLERYFGTIDAVSFHQPSDVITCNMVKIAHINTYDRDDMKGFEYFSDSAQRWSKEDPLTLIQSHPGMSFQILTHPFLWGETMQSFSDLSLRSIAVKAQKLYNYNRKYARGINDRLKCVFVNDEQ